MVNVIIGSYLKSQIFVLNINLPKSPCKKKTCVTLEPIDVDQTYQVLKQAGEISGGKTAVEQTQITTIPVLNVPDYPERSMPRRGPPKPGPPAASSKSSGLAAPTQDVSSSGPPYFSNFNLSLTLYI